MSKHLPVYGPDKEHLYNVPAEHAESLVKRGLARKSCRPNGEVKGLVALCRDLRDLALDRPRGGTKFSDSYESDENPRGVWTFKRRSLYGT